MSSKTTESGDLLTHWSKALYICFEGPRLQVITVNYPKKIVQWGDLTYPLRLADNKCGQVKPIQLAEALKERDKLPCFLRLCRRMVIQLGESRVIKSYLYLSRNLP